MVYVKAVTSAATATTRVSPVPLLILQVSLKFRVFVFPTSSQARDLQEPLILVSLLLLLLAQIAEICDLKGFEVQRLSS